ncbi:hypothetical protein [Agrococcus jenensis]|uniref:Uncharacterized protein n=1 Tax=Agrococcus jenensis TaxID=46353 RepID=A0A3N2AR60_9MICO|nr:hypothetical protein [Agrococcus jenensis]ROR65539.1 hypothetical protein EDD26_0905 [Agrococcus jenensis]
MSRSSRTLNRMLLALLGTAWLALGAVVVLWHVRPDLVHAALSPLAATAAALDWTIVAAAAGAVLVLLAAVHGATRGRGRSGDAVADHGIAVDKHAVRDLYRLELGTMPDVLDVDVQPWWARRGRPAWRIALHVRHGARLDEVVERAATAAERTQQRLGAQVPILIHVSGGLRAAVASARRAE